MGLGVVQTQAQAFEMSRRVLDIEFPEIGAAIPNFSDDRKAVEVDPGIRATQWPQQASDMNFPGAELKVKIMLAISVLGRAQA